MNHNHYSQQQQSKTKKDADLSSQDNPLIQINRPQNMGIDSEAVGAASVVEVPTDGNNSFVGMRVTSGLPFPFKLHSMLDHAAEGGYENVVSWSGDNGFLVHDKDAFVGTIIPKYFSQTKYRSFQRLLNMWGFQRLREGPRKGAYYHDQFQRGNPGLCGSMKCEKIKKKAKAANNANYEKKPNEKESKEKGSSLNKVPSEKKVVTFDRAAKPPSATPATSSAPLPSFEDTFGQVKQIIPVGKATKSSVPAKNHRYADVFDPKTHNKTSGPLPTYSDLFEDRRFHEVSKRDKIARVYGPNSNNKK